MKYIFPGTSDLAISQLGFGCMSLPKAAAGDAADMVAIALGAGINYFDTADLYDKGANETLIGRLLRPHRHKVILATKVGNEWRPDGSGWNWNPRKAYIFEAVEKSLMRLQTDYIDLYQLHGGTIEDPIEETIEAFEQLVQQGKIKYYGISSIRPNVIRAYVARSHIQTVMMQYSLLDRRPEEAMTGLLHDNQKSILARGVLAQGLLINKPAKDYLTHSTEEASLLQAFIQGAGGDVPGSTAIALHYVLQNPAVASAVTGFSSVAQLQEVIAAYNTPAAPEILAAAGKILAPKKYAEHR